MTTSHFDAFEPAKAPRIEGLFAIGKLAKRFSSKKVTFFPRFVFRYARKLYNKKKARERLFFLANFYEFVKQNHTFCAHNNSILR